MPTKAKPPAKARPAAAPSPPNLDAVAVQHRANDAPALVRWVDDLLALLPEGVLGRADETDLSACGAGMSAAQRATILRVLRKCTG